MAINRKISLEEIAKNVRFSVLEMITNSGSSHIGAAFSIIDILTALYFKVLKINVENSAWEKRDRFILSKGHAGAALYAVLGHKGFYPKADFVKYAKNGSVMAGHIVKDSVPGMEITGGSLGHGLSLGLGMSLALKRDKFVSNVFVLMGDGECNEGSVWEAAMVAKQYKLNNLILIIDRNREQSMGSCKEIMDMEPFREKWKAFGWHCLECNGHSFPSLLLIFKKALKVRDKPCVIIANTVKGKGVSYMEKNPLTWHYKTPRGDLYGQAKKELT